MNVPLLLGYTILMLILTVRSSIIRKKMANENQQSGRYAFTDTDTAGGIMIYVTGDTHGIQRKWKEQIVPVLSAGDILLICGDFGMGFWSKDNPQEEEAFFDVIAQQPYSVAFIDGNHENFTKLDHYPIETWNGGKVHFIRKNLIHLMRGECYCIEGNTVFAFGGGYSLDRWRRTENISWWAQEMPSPEEYRRAEDNLQKLNYQVDFLLTHTAPGESVLYLSGIPGLGIKGFISEEQPLTGFLDYLQQKLTYRHWYFGHFHVDEDIWRNQTAVMNAVRELKTGKIVRQWELYETMI